MITQYQEEKKLREEIAALEKMTEQDEKVIAFKKEILRQQLALQDHVNNLQDCWTKSS